MCSSLLVLLIDDIEPLRLLMVVVYQVEALRAPERILPACTMRFPSRLLSREREEM